MVKIDFDMAYQLSEQMNSLSGDYEKVIAHSKKVDGAGVSFFSPSAVANSTDIQTAIISTSDLYSNFNSNYDASIDLLYGLYEGIAKIVDNMNELKEKPSNKPHKLDSKNNYIIGPTEDGKMLRIMFDGEEFVVANTKVNIFDYEEHLLTAKVYQNAQYNGINGRQVGGGQCQLLAIIYAIDAMNGGYRGKLVTQADIEDPRKPISRNEWSPYNYMNGGIAAENKEDVLEFSYNELLEGRPVAIQTTQEDTNKDGSRHWVTFFGYSSDVKGPEDLKPENMLVIDCLDGSIHRLSECGNNGRDLYDWEGKYQVNAAGKDFKKELVKKVSARR